MAGVLGDGVYRLLIRNRGGGGSIGQIFADTVNWRRVLDDTSGATISIAQKISECRDVFRKIRPWVHELQIIRSGVPVWAGPITDVDGGSDSAIVRARDLTQWFERRRLPFDRDLDTDLGAIFGQYVEDALALDPSPNITVNPGTVGVTGRRRVLASQRRIAADELRELASTGVDYTAVNRQIFLGGATIPTGRLPGLHSEHVVRYTVKNSGLQAANHPIVAGAGVTAAGVSIVGEFGPVGNDVAETGLLERYFSEPSILDVPTAERAAETRYDLLNGTPEYVTAELGTSAPYDVNDLVPGAVGPLYLTGGALDAVGERRLRDVNVTAAGGNSELFVANFEPLGTEA